MNRYIRNFVVGVSSAAIIFCSFTPSFASKPFIIHEEKMSENISSGVIHETIKQFNANGWWNINVLRINLDDQYTDIKTLFSKDGISKRDTITNMMKSSNVVGAINGDYFSTVHNSYPEGVVIDGGIMVSSPYDTWNQGLPVFAVDNYKNPSISFWDWSIKVIAQNGAALNVKAMNKESKLHEDIIIYDKNWNSQSLGNKVFNDLIEVVVVNDYVSEIRVGQPPISFPQDGYIITGRGSVANQLSNNFHVGERVSLEYHTSPDYNSIVAAIGGGSPLLKDGARTPFKINIQGDHPRTAIGITRDKREIIMATIDGRDTSYKGVSQETMADIMLTLGAYDAINLDGGGSTTMAIKPAGTDDPVIVNRPSEGSQRKVTNGIGVTSTAPQGDLSYIKVYTDDSKMFVNTTRKFYIKGFDEFHNPVDVDDESVQFFIDGINGKFNGNVLTANSSGEGTVKAFYNNTHAEMKIKVLGDVKELQLETDKFGIDASSQKSLGKIYGKNSQGHVALIESNDIAWESIGNVGYVQDGIFYSADKPAAGALVARLGSAVESTLVSVGFEEIMINDFEGLGGISFLSYPNVVTGSIEQSSDSKVGLGSVKLRYDFTGSDETRAAYIAFGEKGVQLSKNPEKIGMWVYGNENNSWIRGQMSDANGKAIKLDFATNVDWKGWKFVTANIPSDAAYPVTLERIYVTEINPMNKYSGELLFDGLKAMYPKNFDVVNLPSSTSVKDEKQKTVDTVESGFKFIMGFGIDKLDNLYKQQIAKQITNRLSNSKYGFFMGQIDESLKKGTNAKIVEVSTGYLPIRDGDILFIRADSSKGGLRASNPEQWIGLKNDLSIATQNNIIIAMSKPVFGSNGFTDKLEAKLLHDTLVQYAEKGKNIWVVSNGGKNEVDLRDGVRYIELSKPNLNTTSTTFDLRLLEFSYNNGELTYDFVPVFKK
ncbi:phosphodiester glycosidase family protein [Proteiniborus sp. MB09-C3]|uniref:phosphodiester glycosidase family protein n=1 Tax=Proteiniborus sp. MB09-C3 TaxID=3050072 RepID=UPI002556B0B8|nr:phosphodiester glycosidase family protein [Proteiniborus sp. MB09-C3]WIV12069.1 phosphodiester glycosidase family protein [Proteiniborus sp. MB09-C3]